MLGEIFGSATVVGKGGDSRKRVLIAHESAEPCFHAPDGDQGSRRHAKSFLDRGKKGSISSLKRFAFRSNCGTTALCHECVKRKREALLAAISRDGSRGIARAHQRRNCPRARAVGLGFASKSALPSFEPFARVAARSCVSRATHHLEHN